MGTPLGKGASAHGPHLTACCNFHRKKRCFLTDNQISDKSAVARNLIFSQFFKGRGVQQSKPSGQRPWSLSLLTPRGHHHCPGCPPGFAKLLPSRRATHVSTAMRRACWPKTGLAVATPQGRTLLPPAPCEIFPGKCANPGNVTEGGGKCKHLNWPILGHLPFQTGVSVSCCNPGASSRVVT